ncbi:MAG: TIGR00725 family protein [Candidatus Aminicenantes bacterium RBG_19FT_COMBO_59_29]|nr:MAG: TIGR00725 family protein [Candidatus Aminicenantes bacterium RBG_19FT_COMBO_59_29]
MRIGVIGGSSPDDRAILSAFRVGQAIGEAGAILICGGLGGVMEAAASGAKKAGGLSVGILPGTGRGEANPYIDLPIATGLGYSRNSLVALNSDILIAIAGEYGTLSEIAYGNIYKKKVIGLDTWEVKGVIKAKTPEEAVRMALNECA